MEKLIIVHTNDIHGRIEGLTRIGTLISRIRTENAGTPVLYFDIGDSEEYMNRLSSLTKGIALHRLLSAVGCNATVVGNAVLSRYGPKMVTKESAVSSYPHLAANVRLSDGHMIPGTLPMVILQGGERRLGLVGVTAEMNNYERFFGLQMRPAVSVVKELSQELYHAGAEAVILLSHLGLEADREIAATLQNHVMLILGGHSHDLLPHGEWVGDILIAQAGDCARHLGVVELEWKNRRLHPVQASVLPVTETIEPLSDIQTIIQKIENEVQEHLSKIICCLPFPLDYAIDKECGMGNILADALRHRTGAEIGLSAPGPKFTHGLPSGPLRRETLWSICSSTACPGVAHMTGVQLKTILQRGLNSSFAAERSKALRGHTRGLLHISGASVKGNQIIMNGEALDSERTYRIAASDFEFEPLWGYVDETWQLFIEYEADIIMREVLDDYLSGKDIVDISMERLGSSVNRIF